MQDTQFDAVESTAGMINHVYDLWRWKPIPIQRYTELLGIATTTFDEPETLKITCETLPDGRIRMVMLANASQLAGGPQGMEGMGHPFAPLPYLMQLYSPEKGESFYFVRTDVALNLS